MKKMLVAVLAGFLNLAMPAFAQTEAEVSQALDQLFGEHKPYAEFFANLQKAVIAGDRNAVAALVDYPFQARIGGKAVKIRDAKHFISDYDKVITPKVKEAVARQTYATLFANWQGVSIGDGEVWFSAVGEKNMVRITAIND